MTNDDLVAVKKKNLLLSISIVTYNPDFSELEETLSSLKMALDRVKGGEFSITIVDNSLSSEVANFLWSKFPNLPVNLVHGHGNIGFGRAHNIAVANCGEFHLILNPDIQLSADALVNALAFMRANGKCGLLSPSAAWPTGERQYLCKSYPTVFDLFLRGFAPHRMRSLFDARLARYEMRSETQNKVYWNPPIVSGCFMFFRGNILKQTEGFSDKYFLYFEDFDLSLRSRKVAATAYVPSVRIVHSGGHASTKGVWHIKVFVQSAITFFSTHGLKVY